MNMVDIYDAQARLKNTVHHTALERSLTFSRMVGGDLYLKCENLQITENEKYTL